MIDLDEESFEDFNWDADQVQDVLFSLEFIDRFLKANLDCSTYYSMDSNKNLEIEFSGAHNPAGEDWVETFVLDLENLEKWHVFTGVLKLFQKELDSCCLAFDIDEDVSIWIGPNGETPHDMGVRALLENAEYKEEKLKTLNSTFDDVVKIFAD